MAEAQKPKSFLVAAVYTVSKPSVVFSKRPDSFQTIRKVFIPSGQFSKRRDKSEWDQTLLKIMPFEYELKDLKLFNLSGFYLKKQGKIGLF